MTRFRPHPSRRRLGMTLVEVAIASAVSFLIAGSAMALMAIMAKQQRVAMTETRIQAESSAAVDWVLQLARSGSRSATATLTNPLDSDSTLFRTLRFEESDGTMREIRFDADTGSIIYDPDREVGGNDRTLFDSPTGDSLMPRLTDMTFYYPDTSDRTTVAVSMEFTDQGRTWEIWKSNHPIEMEFVNNLTFRGP